MDCMDSHRRRDNDNDDDSSPPAKRRKMEAKPRTTEFLDLSSSASDEAQKTQLDKLLKVLYKKRKIVVVAGAGISVSAGSMYPPTPKIIMFNY
jgi:NAD-dependent histone deacetylase SIR2